MRERTVSKANELIQRSRFSLSLQQQKVVLYLISQIEQNDDDFKLYDFSIQDFCRICGIDCENGKNYSNLKRTLKDIADTKSVWIKLDDGRETIVRWVEKPYIDYQSGIIQIKLDNDMKPFLLQLKEKYTKYELIYILRFKSKYSIRLYELVKSIHYHELETYQKIFEVKELKRILDAENYTETRDFKRKALFPAIQEINRFSDKNVEFEEVKKGRKITHIKLIISTKDAINRLNIRNELEKDLKVI